MSSTIIGSVSGVPAPSDFFDALVTDRFTQADAYETLLVRTATCPQILRVRITATWSFTIGKDSTLGVAIFINGIQQTAGGGGQAGAQQYVVAGSLAWGDASDIPTQSVEFKWRCVNGQGDGIWCRPQTESESCTLRVLWFP